jgi:hypothetical protein
MAKNSYERSAVTTRGENVVKIGDFDQFNEVPCKINEKITERVGNFLFESFHEIRGTMNQRILTALKSKECPEVLFFVWEDFPSFNHIEAGGDVILQEIKKYGAKYMLVDNTFVRSGWVTDKIVQYMDQVWYPGLIELGLTGFAHVQAQSASGTRSFEEFGKDIQSYLDGIASTLNRPCFKYVPVPSQYSRRASLSEGLNKLLTL